MGFEKYSTVLKKKIRKPEKSLKETIDYINNKKKWNLKESRHMINNLYQFQLDDHIKKKGNNQNITFYIKYMEHIERNLKRFESSLLTLIATIFLPLSFIVGFFGMNFKSMGAPSLSKGIFNIEHAQKHIFMVCLIIVIFVCWFFYSYLKLI